jgi:hypothetical protein
MKPALFVDPFLHGHMRLGLELQVSLFRFGAVLVVHGPFDIDGVRLVTFDPVAVVAVHRPNEVGQRPHDASGQTPAKTGRPGGELDGQIV